MLRPDFSLSQTDSSVTISISVKYAKMDDAEFLVEDNTFMFYLSPYLLKLQFSGALQEEGNLQDYDEKLGVLTCVIKKAQPGTKFDDFDNPKKLIVEDAVIEDYEVDADSEEQFEKKEEIKVEEIKEAPPVDLHIPKEYYYGFNNTFVDVINFEEPNYQAAVCMNPREIPIGGRFKAKEEMEDEVFDPERYACDNYDEEVCELVNAVLKQQVPIEQQLKDLSLDGKQYTPEEEQSMSKLPLLAYECSKDQHDCILSQLADILYAYNYDMCVNGYEHTSQSPWTIIKLSATLSCFIDYSEFQPFQNKVYTLVRSCLRRALIYPLYRNYDLALKVLDLNIALFTSSDAKVRVVKALVDIMKLFEEEYFLYNKCFIDQLCVYARDRITDEELIEVGKLMQVLREKIQKEMLGLDLEEVDQKAMEYKQSLQS